MYSIQANPPDDIREGIFFAAIPWICIGFELRCECFNYSVNLSPHRPLALRIKSQGFTGLFLGYLALIRLHQFRVIAVGINKHLQRLAFALVYVLHDGFHEIRAPIIVGMKPVQYAWMGGLVHDRHLLHYFLRCGGVCGDKALRPGDFSIKVLTDQFRIDNDFGLGMIDQQRDDTGVEAFSLDRGSSLCWSAQLLPSWAPPNMRRRT